MARHHQAARSEQLTARFAQPRAENSFEPNASHTN